MYNMDDIEDEVAFSRGMTNYEDFVISLMANKTAEQVDGTELTAEDIEKARHLSRNIRMFGKFDPDVIDQNYIKAVAEGDPLAKEYEAEKEYLEKHGEDSFDMTCPPQDIYDEGEYDGRDDDFIAGITSGRGSRFAEPDRAVEEPDAELEPGEEINQAELDMYMKFQ